MNLRTLAAIVLATAALAGCGDGSFNPAPAKSSTVADFAVSETKTHTCSTINAVALTPDAGGITLTDSDAAVDLESVTPGCNGGPAS